MTVIWCAILDCKNNAKGVCILDETVLFSIDGHKPNLECKSYRLKDIGS